MEDKRFNIIGQDPRFRQMPKAERKVKIDRRFEGMFKDKKFKLKYSVDKRGHPLSATTDDNLRRFYEMSESDSDDEDGKVMLQTTKKKSKNKKETTNLDKKSSKKDSKSKQTIHDVGISKSDGKTSKLKSKAKQKQAPERKARELVSGKQSKLSKKEQRHSTREPSDGKILSIPD